MFFIFIIFFCYYYYKVYCNRNERSEQAPFLDSRGKSSPNHFYGIYQIKWDNTFGLSSLAYLWSAILDEGEEWEMESEKHYDDERYDTAE